jgi:hypothetical protein
MNVKIVQLKFAYDLIKIVVNSSFHIWSYKFKVQ